MTNPSIAAFTVTEITAIIRTDGYIRLGILIKNIYTLWGGNASFCLLHTFRRSSDADQEYVYFMGSETLQIKNIYTLWGRKRFYSDHEYIYFMGSETLPSALTYFPTSLVYPFTLRETGKQINGTC